MAMRERFRALRAALWPLPAQVEAALEQCLYEAFWEEALAQPPQGAWERLRFLLERRRARRQGMWVLGEPLRDPPEAPPMLLSCEQYQRACRLYANSRLHPPLQLRDALFHSLLPTFAPLINF